MILPDKVKAHILRSVESLEYGKVTIVVAGDTIDLVVEQRERLVQPGRTALVKTVKKD